MPKRQKLLTKEIINKMPPSRAQAEEADPMVYAKWFSIANGWTWYAYEGWHLIEGVDGELREESLRYELGVGEKIVATEFMGMVYGFEAEIGPFSLNEFEQVNASRPFPVIERDAHFKPMKLSEIKNLQQHRGHYEDR